jgi:hypothetical protein
MDSEMNAVMAKLANEGVRVDLDRSDKREDVFITELPNGNRCKFLRSRLLKLMADEKLNVAGIVEAGTRR